MSSFEVSKSATSASTSVVNDSGASKKPELRQKTGSIALSLNKGDYMKLPFFEKEVLACAF